MARPIEGLSRRAARRLELDRARLEQYYDDLERDLKRRLQRAEGDREATLRDKLASVQAERGLKLADAEARYRLRVDLELVAAQVVTQPKLELQVQIENRNTAIQRRVVWDPLLRAIEPLTCDVCGQPGLSLQLSRRPPGPRRVPARATVLRLQAGVLPPVRRGDGWLRRAAVSMPSMPSSTADSAGPRKGAARPQALPHARCSRTRWPRWCAHIRMVKGLSIEGVEIC